MRRFGGIRSPFLGAGLGAALVVLACGGCSSDKKATPPATSAPTTTTSAPTSTSTEPSTSTSTSTTEATPAPTTVPAGVPTTRAASGVSIHGFVVSPASPVCNSPTEIQLSWAATGATTVDLAIDGQKFASYPGGPQTHLEYFACDGKPHTYVLTARGTGGGLASATKVVRATATG